jgi:hypothetical protein
LKIAVVILNWNGKQLLEQFLPSVIQFSSEAKVYVADNASTDTSIAFLKEHYPEVTIIQNNINGGYANGYNDALPFVKEELYCLLNSDVEVTKDWLKPIYNLFTEKEEVAIIQPKILDFKNKIYFEYAGAAGGFIDKYGYPFCRGRIFDTVEKDDGQYNDTSAIFWASGACFFIRKQAFIDLGGFDTHFFAHQEEIDLCWRAFNANLQTYYVGTSTVYHVGGATLSKYSAQKTYLNFRNSLFMLLKNLPSSQLIPILITRKILDGIAAFKFLFSAQPQHFIAVFRAHLAFYAKLYFFYKKRNQQKKRRNYYLVKSIVSTYYVYKVKFYQMLIKK